MSQARRPPSEEGSHLRKVCRTKNRKHQTANLTAEGQKEDGIPMQSQGRQLSLNQVFLDHVTPLYGEVQLGSAGTQVTKD